MSRNGKVGTVEAGAAPHAPVEVPEARGGPVRASRVSVGVLGRSVTVTATYSVGEYDVTFKATAAMSDGMETNMYHVADRIIDALVTLSVAAEELERALREIVERVKRYAAEVELEPSIVEHIARAVAFESEVTRVSVRVVGVRRHG